MRFLSRPTTVLLLGLVLLPAAAASTRAAEPTPSTAGREVVIEVDLHRVPTGFQTPLGRALDKATDLGRTDGESPTHAFGAGTRVSRPILLLHVGERITVQSSDGYSGVELYEAGISTRPSQQRADAIEADISIAFEGHEPQSFQFHLIDQHSYIWFMSAGEELLGVIVTARLQDGS